MTLSEHVYCVAVAFNEWVGQWICIKLCIKVRESSMETIQMIQRAAAMATGDWQLHYDNMPSLYYTLCRDFWRKVNPCSPDLATCSFWLFPKLKLPLKGKIFQTISEIQENTMGQVIEIGRTVWGPKVPTLRGTDGSLSYVQCFLFLQ